MAPCLVLSCNACLVGADAHRRLDRVIAHEKLGQRQRVALTRAIGTIGDIDATDLVAQMARLRDEIPQQILDPLGSLVGDIAVDLKYVDRFSVPIAGKFEMEARIAAARRRAA